MMTATTKLDAAVNWLREHMQPGQCYPVCDVECNARMVGISPRTLRRARGVLGVKAAKRGLKPIWDWVR
jgi:hypothetical protein